MRKHTARKQKLHSDISRFYNRNRITFCVKVTYTTFDVYYFWTFQVDITSRAGYTAAFISKCFKNPCWHLRNFVLVKYSNLYKIIQIYRKIQTLKFLLAKFNSRKIEKLTHFPFAKSKNFIPTKSNSRNFFFFKV